jgi:hypothetical protein
MPYPRPVSPLSLETCASPLSDIDTDDLIGSDDELNEVSRAAKRRRIEKLAESYLRGKPLFILSASLKGPLGEGWKNPWKKNRTHGNVSHVSADSEAKVLERVVQETDVRAPRYKEGLLAATHRPEIPASSLRSLGGTSVQARNPPSSSRSPRRESKPFTPRPAHGENGVARSPMKSSNLPSSSAESRINAPTRTSDWLRKDRTFMNFKSFEPPTSPTRSVASRHSDKVRRPPTRRVQVQVPQTPGYHPTQTAPAKTIKAAAVNSNGQLSPRSARSTHSHSSTSLNVSKVPKSLPFQQAKFPPEASLQIVHSSSQLPRFEYRRWFHEQSKSPLQDESILQEETILYDETPLREQIQPAPPLVSSAKDQPVRTSITADPDQPPNDQALVDRTNDQILVSAAPDNDEKKEAPKEKSPNRDEERKSSSKDLRFADEEDIVNEEDNGAASRCMSPSAASEQITTEQNTCEDLPSAQVVPTPFGISDRVTSLHSTALPKGDSGITSEASPDPQLSTQAALLHAQKSFQDDLNSPAYYATTPGQNQAVHSPSGASYSANVTPFYRFEDSLRRDVERNTMSHIKDKTKATSTQFMLDAATPFNFSTEQAGQDMSWDPINKNTSQAMNTQFMLDAATPFAFSTEKKQRATRPEMSRSPSPEPKKRKTHVTSPSISPQSESTNMDSEYHSAESSPVRNEQNMQPKAQDPDHLPYQSTTDASLPLSMSESQPTMGQDGQGAHQAVESFNLSQAIADAGSWLQQSFDFIKDTGRPSQGLQSLH